MKSVRCYFSCQLFERSGSMIGVPCYGPLRLNCRFGRDSSRILVQQCPKPPDYEQLSCGLWLFAPNRSFMNQWLNQRIVGTVITKASVETRSIEAASDSTALYRAAKRTTTVARGKLQHTSASRAKGLWTCNRCSRTNRTADCTVTRAREPTNTAGEMRTG